MAEQSQKKAAHNVPVKWGLCLGGSENAFCCALDVALASHRQNNELSFSYCEIGFAFGDTIAAVHDYLSQAGVTFSITGVDIASQIMGMTLHRLIVLKADTYLWGSSKFFVDFEGALFDFIFIDACHGKDCVKHDFLGAEKMIKRGGVIAFHDTDPEAQGQHPQVHCKQPIGVRDAMTELGLLTGEREGWQIIGETLGELRNVGGCLFLQRAT